MSGILAGYYIDISQHADRALAEVCQITNRGGDDVQNATLSFGRMRNHAGHRI